MMAPGRQNRQIEQDPGRPEQAAGAVPALPTGCARPWRGIALGVALLAAAACGGAEPPAEPVASSQDEPAAGAVAAATLVSPGEEVSLSEGFSFRWTAPEGAADAVWRVVVLEGPQRAIWRSPEGPETEMEAPPGLLLRLAPERAYTWRVLGRVPGQGRLEPVEGAFIAR